MNFFAELKRRNVVRMAGFYLVGAWLLVQVAGTVLPMFGAPDWLPRSIVILLAIGFIPALIFSWVFELTPQGLKRTRTCRPSNPSLPQTARRMDRMIIVVLAWRSAILRSTSLCSRAEARVARWWPAPRLTSQIRLSLTQNRSRCSPSKT